MSKFHCEMFGHFIYDESLTYQELLDVEAQLVGNVQILLENQQAVHIDFSPLGDELMVQCAFDECDTTLFSELCDTLRPYLHHSVEGRLLFVDKHLADLYIFHINHMQWKELRFAVPSVQEALNIPAHKHKRRATDRKE